MRYVYTGNDFDKISWERIDNYINKMVLEIKEFIEKNSLQIKYIVPILRGGGIPAILFSHKLNVLNMLPVQLKYNHTTKEVDKIIDFNIYKNLFLEENECILLVEGNHVSGKTANMVKEMILKTLPNAKIIYASITRDYYFKDSLDNIMLDVTGMYTNETKRLSEEECKKLNINHRTVSLYPWEDISEELEELNNSTSH